MTETQELIQLTEKLTSLVVQTIKQALSSNEWTDTIDVEITFTRDQTGCVYPSIKAKIKYKYGSEW